MSGSNFRATFGLQCGPLPYGTQLVYLQCSPIVNPETVLFDFHKIMVHMK